MDQAFITIDRRRSGQERPISFCADDDLVGLPMQDRYSIVLITNGFCILLLNSERHSVTAPATLCLSPDYTLTVITADNLCAKSFHFHPSFLHMDFSFANDNTGCVRIGEDLYTSSIFEVFVQSKYCLCSHTPENAIRINEWLSLICMETLSQSDSRWTCRIRGYMLHILHLLMNKSLYQNDSDTYNPIISATRFIHTNYQNSIKIEDICRFVHLNRTSLNEQFRNELHMSIKEYLNNYRLDIAKETLRHTSLPLDEIAYSCGFQFAPYFIKQFQKGAGMTPTQYRVKYKNKIPDSLEMTGYKKF